MLLSTPLYSIILSHPLQTHSSPLNLQPKDLPTIPTACDIIPKWTVSTFIWQNSTHNLDCASPSGPDIGDGTTCLKTTNSTGEPAPCDPALETCSTCGVPVCSTGLPLQPLGYGPPDSVRIVIENGYSCYQTNPQAVHRAEVGEGYVNCGGTAYYLFFYGDSNGATGTGHIDYSPLDTWTCANGSTIRAEGSVDFGFACEHDTGGNATCTAEPFVIPVTGFTIS